MPTAFETAFEETLEIEGLYSDDPQDSGGETKFGITEATARLHGYNGRMKDLPLSFAKEIYRASYWDKMLLDRVASVAGKEVAAELFDTGVNMSPKVAGEFLQRSLNVFNNRGKIYDDIAVDGIIGPKTLEALTKYIGYRGQEGRDVLLKALNGLQAAKFIQLAEHRVKDEKYVWGWIKNRVT